MDGLIFLYTNAWATSFHFTQVALIRSNPASVISGETGCGKTTQVSLPTFLNIALSFIKYLISAIILL